MADADSAAAFALLRSPAAPETSSTQKRWQRGPVSRVWKGIFGCCEDVEKLLQALCKEEDALRSRVHRRARAFRTSAHNVLAIASTLEVIAAIAEIFLYRTMLMQKRKVREKVTWRLSTPTSSPHALHGPLHEALVPS